MKHIVKALYHLAPLVALACDGGQNRSPTLLALNGVDLPTGLALLIGGYPQDPAWAYTAGETFEIELEIEDKDGDAVRVWWPLAPPGLLSDPDLPRATWEVPPPEPDTGAPEGGAYWEVTVVLDDQDPDDPRWASYRLPLYPSTGSDVVPRPGGGPFP